MPRALLAVLLPLTAAATAPIARTSAATTAALAWCALALALWTLTLWPLTLRPLTLRPLTLRPLSGCRLRRVLSGRLRRLLPRLLLLPRWTVGLLVAALAALRLVAVAVAAAPLTALAVSTVLATIAALPSIAAIAAITAITTVAARVAVLAIALIPLTRLAAPWTLTTAAVRAFLLRRRRREMSTGRGRCHRSIYWPGNCTPATRPASPPSPSEPTLDRHGVGWPRRA